MEQSFPNLIKDAAEAAMVLSKYLNFLLDAYEYHNLHHADRTSILELRDIEVTISQLGVLPHEIVLRLNQWQNDVTPVQSPEEFEISALNELEIHLNALFDFLDRKKIALGDFDGDVQESINTLRTLNRYL